MPLNNGANLTGEDIAGLIRDNFMTTAELANLKSVSRRTIGNWLEQGIAPAYETFAGHNWFYRDAAEAFEKPKVGRRKK